MITRGGHKGSIALPRLLDIIDRHSYKQRHVAWNERGVKAGLPPDVVTILIGETKDGYWWNVRKGMIPEHTVRTKGYTIEDSATHDSLMRMGWRPGNDQPGAISTITERALTTRVPAKLVYIGWREILCQIIKHRKIRDCAEAEELLGTFEYRKTLMSRARWEKAINVGIEA